MNKTAASRESSGILCIGETMAQLSAVPPSDLSSAETLALSFAGAESTVALYLTHLGWEAGWMSRLGDDPFGHRFLGVLTEAGVDVTRVDIDRTRPTGVYFKHPTPQGTKVYYYREGSAASRMSPAQLVGDTLRGVGLVHLTGINPALSESMAALTEHVFDQRTRFGFEVSFDINFRPRLWSQEAASPVLLELARRADVVFVGLDEAQVLWGSETPEDVASILGPAPEVVVKDGAVGATAYCGAERTFVPALSVEVVEPVGAGDSFAAGYLHERLKGSGVNTRLNRGHEFAAAVLGTTEDFVVPEGISDVPVH